MNICNNCIFFVNDIDGKCHETAKKTREGFCGQKEIKKVSPYEVACKKYVDDNREISWEDIR